MNRLKRSQKSSEQVDCRPENVVVAIYYILCDGDLILKGFLHPFFLRAAYLSNQGLYIRNKRYLSLVSDNLSAECYPLDVNELKIRR